MMVSYETERLRLELYNRKHIRETVRFYRRNAEALREYEPSRIPEFYTESYHRRQIGYDMKDMRELRYLSFVILKKEDAEKIIGFVNFSDISFGVFRSCRVGYKMDKDERNRGYMREALGRLIRAMFEELRLHRIEANVMPFNSPSIKLLETLGFEKEGYSRKYLRINGRWEDHINFAMINEGEE